MSAGLAGNGDLPVAIGPRWWCVRVVICIAPLSFHPLLRFPLQWLPLMLMLDSLRWLYVVVGFVFDVIVRLLFDILAVHIG